MIFTRKGLNLLLVVCIFGASQVPSVAQRRAATTRREALSTQRHNSRQQAVRPSAAIESSGHPVSRNFRVPTIPMQPNAMSTARRPSPPPQRSPLIRQFDVSGDSPPGLRPPPGIALQLNRAKLKDFMRLAASIRRIRRHRRQVSSSAQQQFQSSLKRAVF